MDGSYGMQKIIDDKRFSDCFGLPKVGAMARVARVFLGELLPAPPQWTEGQALPGGEPQRGSDLLL